jgi:hypothetical protein
VTEEGPGVPSDGREVRAGGFGDLRAPEQPLRGAEDQRERRSELVAHVCEELRLELIELFRLLVEVRDLFVGAHELAVLGLDELARALEVGDVPRDGGDPEDAAALRIRDGEVGVGDRDRLFRPPISEERLGVPVPLLCVRLRHVLGGRGTFFRRVVVDDTRGLDREVRGQPQHAAAGGVDVLGMTFAVRDADQVGRGLDERRKHAALVENPLKLLVRARRFGERGGGVAVGAANALVEHAEGDAHHDEHAHLEELARVLEEGVDGRDQEPPNERRADAGRDEPRSAAADPGAEKDGGIEEEEPNVRDEIGEREVDQESDDGRHEPRRDPHEPRHARSRTGSILVPRVAHGASLERT